MSASSPATIDDLRRVPKDGRVYELVDGAIIVTPAGMRHSSVAARITAVLANFVLPRNMSEVYTEGVGIQLPNGTCDRRTRASCGPRSVLLPDLRVLSALASDRSTWIELAALHAAVDRFGRILAGGKKFKQFREAPRCKVVRTIAR